MRPQQPAVDAAGNPLPDAQIKVVDRAAGETGLGEVQPPPLPPRALGDVDLAAHRSVPPADAVHQAADAAGGTVHPVLRDGYVPEHRIELPPDGYLEGAQRVLVDLAARGYRPVDLKSDWIEAGGVHTHPPEDRGRPGARVEEPRPRPTLHLPLGTHHPPPPP